jgi:Ca2+-binding RTX toxin-like protein
MANPTQGTQSGDILYGTAANDKLLGHQGNDIFDLTSSTGSDTVDGQGGIDTAIFAGRLRTMSSTSKIPEI